MGRRPTIGSSGMILPLILATLSGPTASGVIFQVGWPSEYHVIYPSCLWDGSDQYS
jgi:hypothetical protein